MLRDLKINASALLGIAILLSTALIYVPPATGPAKIIMLFRRAREAPAW